MTIDSFGISHFSVEYPSFTFIIRDLSRPPWLRGWILSEKELGGRIINALPSVEFRATHVVPANIFNIYFFCLSYCNNINEGNKILGQWCVYTSIIAPSFCRTKHTVNSQLAICWLLRQLGSLTVRRSLTDCTVIEHNSTTVSASHCCFSMLPTKKGLNSARVSGRSDLSATIILQDHFSRVIAHSVPLLSTSRCTCLQVTSHNRILCLIRVWCCTVDRRQSLGARYMSHFDSIRTPLAYWIDWSSSCDEILAQAFIHMTLTCSQLSLLRQENEFILESHLLLSNIS